MTQKELAGLMLRGDRARVSAVERTLAAPNGEEIVAYSLIFGIPPADIFPAFYEKVEEAVIERSYALDEQLRPQDDDAAATRKRKLLRHTLARAIGKQPNPLRL